MLNDVESRFQARVHSTEILRDGSADCHRRVPEPSEVARVCVVLWIIAVNHANHAHVVWKCWRDTRIRKVVIGNIDTRRPIA